MKVYKITNDKADVMASEIVKEQYGNGYAKVFERELDLWFYLWHTGKIVYPHAFYAGYRHSEMVALGMICSSPMDDCNFEIRWVIVKKEHRGKGYGAEMVKHLLREIEAENYVSGNILLTCSKKNVKFYEKFGFRVVSTMDKNLMIKQYGKISGKANRN